MGQKTRKDQDRDLRRREIVEAARSLFESRGVENTTMDDIARKAEFTKRTVYAYFACKEDLTIAVFIDSIRERWRYQKTEMEAKKSGIDKLRSFYDTYYRYFDGHRAQLHLMLYLDFLGIDVKKADPGLFAQYQAHNLEMVDQVRRAFRQAIADGTVRPGIDIDTTISYWGYSLRAILHRATHSSYSFTHIDQRHYYYGFFEMLLSAVAPVTRPQKTSMKK